VDPFATCRLTDAGAEALALARAICLDEIVDEAIKSSPFAHGSR
jgi:hypothetical protein